MKKLLILFFFFGSLQSAFTRDLPLHLREDDRDEGKGIGLKIGYEYQRSSYLEAGALFYHWTGASGTPFGFKGLEAGAECRLGGSHFYYGPKLSCEITAFIFGARASLTYLTGRNEKALFFAPELGFTLLGHVYAYFGYNFNFSDRSILNMNGPKLSIGINLYEINSPY
ncbi:MAG TPA: hypothetical protein VFS31_05780 [Chitinophagaceae bacterium]|nr:hypothetical protein [Chitinophagaceae bacterium]